MRLIGNHYAAYRGKAYICVVRACMCTDYVLVRKYRRFSNSISARAWSYCMVCLVTMLGVLVRFKCAWCTCWLIKFGP